MNDCKDSKKDNISWELMGVSNLLRRTMCFQSCAEPESHTSMMQHWIMGFLFDNLGKAEVFQKDIEAQLHMRRSTATGILKNMEKNELIIRRSVARDARLKEIVLTEKALAVKDMIDERAKRVEMALKQGITADEQAELLRILDKVKFNLQTISDPQAEE